MTKNSKIYIKDTIHDYVYVGKNNNLQNYLWHII